MTPKKAWVAPFGVRVRVHPLFLLSAVIACVAHMALQVAILFACVLLHELGHAVMARGLGYRVEEIELLPFGGMAKLAHGDLGCSPRNEALVAIAGPVVNLGLGWSGLALAASGAAPSSAYQAWVTLNLWLAVFNLLPCLPLDGGRLWRASRSRHVGYARATEGAYRMGFAISALLTALGVLAFLAGRPHMGALILGLFLAITAWQGLRDVRVETIRFLDAKRRGRAPVLTHPIARCAGADARARRRSAVRAGSRAHGVRARRGRQGDRHPRGARDRRGRVLGAVGHACGGAVSS